jgi:hypothetical protein
MATDDDRDLHDDERRVFSRKLAKLPVKFRIVREGNETRMSEPVEGTLRDVSETGVALETTSIVVDGLHISYDHVPANKNRVYLQWSFPGGKSIKAVGETVWYERIAAGESLFVVGLRFMEITAQDLSALKEFLGSVSKRISI